MERQEKAHSDSNGKPHTIAVILAAGQGKRMNSRIQKQYLLLKDKPVLYYSLKAFQESLIDDIILVTGPGEIDYVRREIVDKYGFTKVCRIVEGGRERYHSVYEGLQSAAAIFARQGQQIPEDNLSARMPEAIVSARMPELMASAREPEGKGDSSPGYVFIHDGARPFVDGNMISRTYESVLHHKACVAAVPVKDTIKIADEGGFTAETPKRSLVWMIQTPQVFEQGLILRAYSRLIQEESRLLAAGEQITDDAWVIERFTDTRVKLVEGSYENIKITTPEDIRLGEAFL